MHEYERAMILLDQLYDDVCYMDANGETDLKAVLRMIYEIKLKMARLS